MIYNGEVDGLVSGAENTTGGNRASGSASNKN